jgi:hypothetical protein
MKLNGLSNNLGNKNQSNGKNVNNTAKPHQANGVKQPNFGTNKIGTIR